MNILGEYLQIMTQTRTLQLISKYPQLHLTVSWDNPTGEIDVHLTRELSPGRKIHGSILKFTEVEALKFLDEIGEKFRAVLMPLIHANMFKVIRPGWLGRKGYAIFWLSRDEEKGLANKFLINHKKNKQRLYLKVLADLNHIEEIDKRLYEPAILHEISRYEDRGVVQAIKLRGKKKGTSFVITYMLLPNGKRRWVVVDKLGKGLDKDLTSIMNNRVRVPLQQSLIDVFDKLHLDELGINREAFTLSDIPDLDT